jgi:hypothetical protein
LQRRLRARFIKNVLQLDPTSPHSHHVRVEKFWLLKLPTSALRKWKQHAMNVERILREYGQFLRPMSEAPRDGGKILAQSAKGILLCYWDTNPSKLTGPSWVKHEEAERGYLDSPVGSTYEASRC